MNKEIKLSRAERRRQKKETIRKNTKHIPKEEYLNRADRRVLVKNKNLLVEIVKIINKYLPQLSYIIDNLTDKRNKSYIKYNMRTIIFTRLFALICGITTMNGMTRTFNTENTIKNLSVICKQNFNEIPNWQTIQDVLEDLDIEEIRNIRKYIVKTLIRSKMFDKYRYNGYFQVLVDATGVTCCDYNLNGNCIEKKYKSEKTKYYKYVLEAKIVVGKIVISLDSEWIENSIIKSDKQKQDCEINAFKRMAPRIKKDRLKQIFNDFEDDLAYENETTEKNYFLSTKIKYKTHKLNAVRYQEYQKEKLVTFNYITNLKTNNHNIKNIIKMGRSRWKIENEGFNEQKNGTFCISHLCSRNETSLKIHYYLIQIAHIIRQLLEVGSIVLREMKLQKKEVSSHIKNDLTTFNSTSKINTIGTKFQLRFYKLIL